MKLKLIVFGFLFACVVILNYWLSFPTSIEMDAALSQLKGTGVVDTTVWAHLRDTLSILSWASFLMIGFVLFSTDLVNLTYKCISLITKDS